MKMKNMMHYQKNKLMIEEASIQSIVKKWGTPLYLYSHAQIKKNWDVFSGACRGSKHLICYALKANSNLGIIKLFSKLGAGFDIVSQGELERVLLAGGDPQKIIFSGVGKTSAEIKRALEVGIFCFNIESVPELERISAIAKSARIIAPIALRVNPHIPIDSHPYITTGLKHNKFGIAMSESIEAYRYAKRLPFLKIKGLACHLGSQINEITPFIIGLEKLLNLLEKLKKQNIELDFLDMGGGVGIPCRNEKTVDVEKYISALYKKMNKYSKTLVLEPGRALIGNAGVLITKIEYIKKTKTKNFAIVDTAMNDLMRPALYQAWHQIMPVEKRTSAKATYDVVGPVCETGDFLGLDRPLSIKPDDLLAICDVGAYGFALGSNYNSRLRPAEVLVSGKKLIPLRKRETYSDLWRKEFLEF